MMPTSVDLRGNYGIILGCGPSSGVPLVSKAGGIWGDCDPLNPKNRRLRSSFYVRYGGVSFLIDTSPDLRQQLLQNDITTVDAVLMTHDHADHTHGMDELRPLFFARGKETIPLYGDSDTLQAIQQRFGYLFGGQDKMGLYPAILTAHPLSRENPTVMGQRIHMIPQDHGSVTSYGFRFGGLAYSTDFCALSDGACAALENLDVWIVDCLSLTPHKTHLHLEQTLFYIDKIKPKRAILTHMNHSLDYGYLDRILPPHIRPAYDGMVVTWP